MKANIALRHRRRCEEFALFGPVYFLSGDSYPSDSYIEHEIRKRLSPSFARWTGQKDIHHPTPESFQIYDFPQRAAHLESYLAGRSANRDVIVMGRSSGARLATWYAARHPVSAVICFGYPYRNPAVGPEPERYRHLAELTAPTLIFQGLQDEYGGSSIIADYPRSSAIRVHLLRADHYFTLASDAWDRLARITLEFCQDVLPRP